MTDSIKTYAAAEQYILGIPKFADKNTMEYTRRFLGHIGCGNADYMDPEEQGRTIHVAGTNGKGSVCAYLCSILQEAGFSTGMFISPHLVTIRERIVINGSMVSEEEFLRAVWEVEEKLEDMPEELRRQDYRPTFNEYLFFMAMLIFSAHGVRYRILETGLGGRMDATNAVPHKDVCVITSIGYDHMEYLGATKALIAVEKAGICRPGTPLVYWDREKEVTDALEEYAGRIGAETMPISRKAIKEINSVHKTIDFSFQSNYYGYIRFRMPTIAFYQMENAALAVAAVEQLEDRRHIGVRQLQEGIWKMRWEGRMEEIMPSVYLDGAHNADGMQAFLQSVRYDGCTGKRRLLFSTVKDKQYAAMIDMVVQSALFDVVGVVELHNKRALPLQELADYFRQYTELQLKTYDKLEHAVQDMTVGCGEIDRVYIAGSLYLAGEVKTLLWRSSHD